MLLLKGGKVIDPLQGLNKTLDIYIEDDKIAYVGEKIYNKEPLEIIDLAGKTILPGLIDMHAHFREPGFENRETIITGAKAASCGGLTAVCCMPNTKPPIDNVSVVNFYKQKSKESAVEIYPIGCITKNREGVELSEMSALYEAGAVAFSDDGNSVSSSEVMRRALEYSKITNAPIIDHCEEKSLTRDAVINEGYMSTLLGLKGMPAEAEIIQIARDIALAKLTGGKIHIAHLSTKSGVDLIRQAKKEGVKITCEVTINNLLLTENDLINYDTNLKVNPPLRAEDDKKALIKALIDGTIDALVSDHAPWTYEEKQVEFSIAPFGISGVETLAPLAFGELYKKYGVPINVIVRALSYNPAKILNLSPRIIKKGAVANITVMDLDAKYKIDKNKFVSLGKNTPYHGREVAAMPYMTVVNGKAAVAIR